MFFSRAKKLHLFHLASQDVHFGSIVSFAVIIFVFSAVIIFVFKRMLNKTPYCRNEGSKFA